MTRRAVSRNAWRTLAVTTLAAAPLAAPLGAQQTSGGMPPSIDHINGIIWATLSSGETLRGSNATVYLWVDTPVLHKLLATACTAARTNPGAWIGARTELEAPAGMPLDSVAAADLAILRDIASAPHAVTHADSAGRFTLRDVPLGEYWIEAEMPDGVGMAQWWHPLPMTPAVVAAVRVLGRSDALKGVQLGSADFTRREFCLDGVFPVGTPAFSGDAPANDVAPSLAHDEVPARVTVAGPPPQYPEVLRSSGLDGEVDAQFVIDTLGHADMSTFRVLHATRPEFVQPVRESLSRTVFEPARIHGRKARQVVEQQFKFSITTAAPLPVENRLVGIPVPTRP